MVDDYTAKMTELIELMRLIGNDTQQCEVKECKRKISSTITDTLSAFSNGSGGWIILGLSEKNGFTPVEGFDARAMQEALSQACEKMTPVVRPVIVTCPFEGANLVFARIDEMLPRDKPCFTTALGPHGGSFIRTGDGDRRMTSYEVDRLIEEHLQPTYDLDIVPDATTDDLDPQLVAGLLARVREQHPRVFADRDGIEGLARARRAGVPTFVCRIGEEDLDVAIGATVVGEVRESRSARDDADEIRAHADGLEDCQDNLWARCARG